VSRPSRELARWARYADIIALALLALGAEVGLNGGFVIRALGFRWSDRSPWRTALGGVAILAVRHLLVRHPSMPTWIAASARNIARTIRRLPDDRDLLGTPPRPRAQGRTRALITGLAVVLLFTALTAVMTYPQVRHLGSGVSLDIGDPLLSTWRLSWIAHQIVRDPWHLFDGNIFYPARNTLAFSDAILVPALTVAPLLWLGVPQLVAYNLLFLSGFALSGVGMFVLVRDLTGTVGAALVAGFVFAFLPFRFMHYAHLEMEMTQWMPLCLWALHRTIRDGRLRDGLLTGLFFALQTLSCMYYGIFFATFLVPLAAVLLVAEGRLRVVRSARALGAGAALAAALIAPVVPAYLAARTSVGERPVAEIQRYSATPHDYLVAHPRNVMFGEGATGPHQPERELFQGVVVPIVALVALWPPLSAARVGYGIAMLFAFDASLGLNGVSYPWLHAFVLPYKGLRAPARMAILVGLSLSVLVGYGVARLTARRSRWTASGIALAIGLLVCAEYRTRLQLSPVWTTPPPAYDRLKNDPASVLLELPLKEPYIHLEPVYMYFSTFHWHRLINGYSGFSPAAYSQLRVLMATFPDDASIAELRRRDVRFVIVHGALFEQPDAYARTIADMSRDGAFEFVGADPWEGSETRVYRLLPASPLLPAASMF
jgi:hypothetical protein